MANDPLELDFRMLTNPFIMDTSYRYFLIAFGCFTACVMCIVYAFLAYKLAIYSDRHKNFI